jgi:hypothetical protein
MLKLYGGRMVVCQGAITHNAISDHTDYLMLHS